MALAGSSRHSRRGEVDEKEFIRQLIVELVAHEVGHTPGLRHNFKGSTIHALDELHDRRVTANRFIYRP